MLAFKNGITHAFILGNVRCSHKHSVNDNCIHDDNHFFSCHFAFMHEIITNSNKTHVLNLNRKWKCPLFTLFLIYQCAIFVFSDSNSKCTQDSSHNCKFSPLSQQFYSLVMRWRAYFLWIFYASAIRNDIQFSVFPAVEVHVDDHIMQTSNYILMTRLFVNCVFLSLFLSFAFS